MKFLSTTKRETFSTIQITKLEKVVKKTIFSSSSTSSLSVRAYDLSSSIKVFSPEHVKQSLLLYCITSPCALEASTSVPLLITVICVTPFSLWHSASTCWFCWQRSVSRHCTILKHWLTIFMTDAIINKSSHHEISEAFLKLFFMEIYLLLYSMLH